MRLVAIRCWGSMILAKTWLEHVSNVSIGLSSFRCVPWVLVDLIFFLICFMWPFSVAMKEGRCFMSPTVRLVQVVKWTFSMAWIEVLFTGLNRAEWYHLDSSGLLLASRALSAAGCFLGGLVGLLVMLTCHMPDLYDLLPSSTVSPSLTELM